MFGSSRAGGVRGGQDQFNWDDVKVDKHRENYLGERVSGAAANLRARVRGGELHTAVSARTCFLFLVPVAIDSRITRRPGLAWSRSLRYALRVPPLRPPFISQTTPLPELALLSLCQESPRRRYVAPEPGHSSTAAVKVNLVIYGEEARKHRVTRASLLMG